MKKKFSIIVALVLLVVLAVAFTGCNKYEWQSIGGGDANADVLSNGGYAVEQGNYVYFVNGFQGTTAENDWGNVFKQGIMRATLDENGAVVADSFALVVPKHIYSSDTNSGIAVFGEWIYYATPNNEKDKSGTASTTNLDFMRTKIDGSITQKIYTLANRSYPYIFTPSRILYYNANVIYAIDFSGMKTSKNISDGSGAYRTELVTSVNSYTWKYDTNYSIAQSSAASDYIIYTTATTDQAQAHRNCNELNIIKVDGSGKKNLAKFDTYTIDYKIALIDSVIENDNIFTIYYTKTKLVGSTDTIEGVFCNKVQISDLSFDVATEKQLTASNQTKVFPLSYEKGALITDTTDSFIYYLNGTAGTAETYSQKVIGKTTATVQFVAEVEGKDYVYYTDSASAKSLYRINLIENEGKNANEALVLTAGTIKLDWTKLDIIKKGARIDFFYFNTDDYSYLHRVNVAAFDGSTKITESDLFGKMTDADIATKKAAEEAAAKA